ADQAGRALDAISNVVRQSAELVQEISLASKQQVRGTEGVAHAMQIISSITRQTSQGTRGTVATVSQLVKLSDQLNEALAQFRATSKSGNTLENSARARDQSKSGTVMNERQGPAHGLSEHELSEIRMLIEERTGICFDESRERFFSTRVGEHLRAKKFATGTELLRAMRKANVEYEALLERLLTQETSFFRYPAVYETFEKRVLPELHVKKFWKNPRTLRVWSAGCSTGEEPYSIAITIADALSFSDAWNVEILPTDVGRQALKHAERGIYSRRRLGRVTPAQLSAHFAPVEGGHQVKPRLKKMVTFAQMNLASAVYVGRMDLIFCMNVLI